MTHGSIVRKLATLEAETGAAQAAGDGWGGRDPRLIEEELRDTQAASRAAARALKMGSAGDIMSHFAPRGSRGR
jgi:hypothetical protein